MAKKNISKIFINRRTGQSTIILSKKLIRRNEPNLKFNEDVFVEWKILRKKRKR